MTIEAAVFDMDGLMLDTEPIYKSSWQLAAAGLGYEIDDAFYATFIGRPTPDYEALLVGRFGDDFPLESFRAQWPVRWKQTAVEDRAIALKAGLIELLDYLQRKQFAIAVATSSDPIFTGLSLRSAGLDSGFDVIVTGDQVSHGKPAPDIYLEVARAFEDSEAGILAAKDVDPVAKKSWTDPGHPRPPPSV